MIRHFSIFGILLPIYIYICLGKLKFKFIFYVWLIL